MTRYYWRCQCGARSRKGWRQEERRDKAYRLHERSKRHIQWVKRRALEKAKRCPMCGRAA